MGAISDFIRHHYRHFNAAALVDAAEGYVTHLDGGGKMLVTLAGAMSTAELGLSLAEMIRQDKVHAICCTGREPRGGRLQPRRARPLRARPATTATSRPSDEEELLERHLNRVTDTCIPEDEAMRRIERRRARRVAARRQGRRALLPARVHVPDPALAARSRSTTRSTRRTAGCSPRRRATCRCSCRAGRTRRSATSSPATASRATSKNVHTVRTGIEYMMALADWYQTTCRKGSIGFFQIGGGIAGDFPICVVPMLQQDLQRPTSPLLGLLLPDQRLDDELRLLLGRRAEREDHLGQAAASTRRSSSSSPTPRSSRR